MPFAGAVRTFGQFRVTGRRSHVFSRLFAVTCIPTLKGMILVLMYVTFFTVIHSMMYSMILSTITRTIEAPGTRYYTPGTDDLYDLYDLYDLFTHYSS